MKSVQVLCLTGSLLLLFSGWLVATPEAAEASGRQSECSFSQASLPCPVQHLALPNVLFQEEVLPSIAVDGQTSAGLTEYARFRIQTFALVVCPAKQGSISRLPIYLLLHALLI